MVNCGIIGLGYWGPNYIRVVRQTLSTTLTWCCDINPDNLSILKNDTSVKTTQDYNDLLNDPHLDAVIIATPTEKHFDITKQALLAGKHVLVEKPLTTDAAQAQELIALAKEKNRVLLTGYIFLYNKAVQKIKEYIQNKEIGNVLYAHFSRTGLGPIRKDVNCVWDLATHDISILSYLIDEKPISVVAKGECYLQKDIEDIAFMTIELENKILANMHISWLDPYKTRKLTIVGDKKMIVFDDISSEPIRLFDKGVSYLERGADYGTFKTLLRDGDILSPKIKSEEPLKSEFNEFIDRINKKTQANSNMQISLQVVKIAQAAQQSLKNDSMKVKIE